MKPASWQTLDWGALDRLRQRFLEGGSAGGDYWTSRADLAGYDFTFGERIGWKWDAVLRELEQRGWTPPAGRPLIDWGCGSGVAGRRVLEFFGGGRFTGLQLFDRSAAAMEFASEKAREIFPGVRVELLRGAGPEAGGPVLVVSHVLNELDEAGGRELRHVIDGADVVLWVEPGTCADSRALIAMREALREQFVVVAPCTHQAGCGLLTAENAKQWCHHFAGPPPGLMADGDWVRFGQRAGIDLRSVPYSFLVLERRGLRSPMPGALPEGWSRLLGGTRVYKGYAKVSCCEAEGVHDLMLQKRDVPELFKALKSGEAEPLQRCERVCGRIAKAQPFRASDFRSQI